MSNRDLNFNKETKDIENKDDNRALKSFLFSVIIAIISVTLTYVFVSSKYNEVLNSLKDYHNLLLM